MSDSERTPPGWEGPLEPLKERVKGQLRQRMRQVRRAHPAEGLRERSQQICDRIAALSWFETARGVGLFWPIAARAEVDLRPLDTLARAAQKRVYYPCMDQSEQGWRTGFRPVLDLAELEQRGRPFLEPDPALPLAERGALDLIVVPALAASLDGHRIGYGSGFYDATLPDFCPPARALIALFDFQLIAEVPALQHDVRCDAVMSERQSAGV